MDRQKIGLQRSTHRSELREVQLIQAVPGKPDGREMSPDQITVPAVKNPKPVLVQEMEDLLRRHIVGLEKLT